MRRAWKRVLAATASAGLLGLIPSRAAAEEQSLSKAPPFFAFCMDTHDSEKRSLEDQAKLLKELGYDGAGHLWLDNLEERLDTFDAEGLKLFKISLQVSIAPDKPPYDPRLPDLMPLLKGRDILLALLMSGLPPSDTAGDERAVEIVREIAALAETAGARVVLYPHSGDWLERVEDAVRLARKVDRSNVGVMFNLCHWLKVDQEANLEKVLTLAMPYLFAVSIHGADHAAEIQAGTGNWIQPLGSGAYDVTTLLKTLTDMGYRGPVGLQCWGIPGDARVHLTQSMEWWKSRLRGAD